jgi:hypothetical protein
MFRKMLNKTGSATLSILFFGCYLGIVFFSHLAMLKLSFSYAKMEVCNIKLFPIDNLLIIFRLYKHQIRGESAFYRKTFIIPLFLSYE